MLQKITDRVLPFRQAQPRPHALRTAQCQHRTTRPDATERRTQTGSMAAKRWSCDPGLIDLVYTSGGV